MRNAVLVSSARCNGQGSDLYKNVSGITKHVLAEIDALGLGDVDILVPSHTCYQGQNYKRVVFFKGRANHRQINDADYTIVARIE